MASAVDVLLAPGTCLKKLGSVRTYRIVESVDGPYVHVRKPNGTPMRLNVEGLFDGWEVGVDSHHELNALLRDIAVSHGDLLALAHEMLDYMFVEFDDVAAEKIDEFASRLGDVYDGTRFRFGN